MQEELTTGKQALTALAVYSANTHLLDSVDAFLIALLDLTLRIKKEAAAGELASLVETLLRVSSSLASEQGDAVS